MGGGGRSRRGPEVATTYISRVASGIYRGETTLSSYQGSVRGRSKRPSEVGPGQLQQSEDLGQKG